MLIYAGEEMEYFDYHEVTSYVNDIAREYTQVLTSPVTVIKSRKQILGVLDSIKKGDLLYWSTN